MTGSKWCVIIHRMRGPLALFLAVIFVPQSAHADAATIAEKLFQEGRRLLAEKRISEACDKFQRSEDLDSSAGTLLNLGNCRELNGQKFSAWKAYNKARSLAKQNGRAEWEATAKDLAAKLEPHLSHVYVHVAQADAAVTIDGNSIAPKEFDVEIPIDAGQHSIEATHGRKTWSLPFGVIDGFGATITVPVFDSEALDTNSPTSPRAWQRPAGWTLVGVGAAGLILSFVTGALAANRLSNAKDLCPALKSPRPVEPVPCSQAAIDYNDSARDYGNISTWGFGAGGILAATGVILILTAPRRSSAVSMSLTPSFERSFIGADLRLRF